MPEELPSEPKNKILLPIISALYFIKAFWQMIQPPQNKKETIKKAPTNQQRLFFSTNPI